MTLLSNIEEIVLLVKILADLGCPTKSPTRALGQACPFGQKV